MKELSEHRKKYMKEYREKNREKILLSKKESSTINLLGYSANDLKKHLEENFQEGMSWTNYGEWHIDHIKPVCSFGKETHPSVVNNLNNLQPLWAKDNFSKGKKIL